MEVLLYTILTLCVLGVLAAVILYVVAQKFKVEEDPRIDQVEKMLPGANCGWSSATTFRRSTVPSEAATA